MSVDNSGSSFMKYKRSDTATLRSKRESSTRANIQEKKHSYAQYQAMFKDLLRSDSSDDSAMEHYEHLRRLLNSAVSFVTAGGNNVISGLDMGLLSRVLRIENFEANDYVYREGDEITKLYLVESGEIEASSADLSSRTITAGQLIGERSLFFTLPSTETVQCITDCTMYSVDRAIFVMIRKMTSIASLLQTSEWLQQSPHLKDITPAQMTTLLALMKPVRVKRGDVLLQQGSPINGIYLVSNGSFKVEAAPTDIDQEERTRNFGIIYPTERTPCVESLTAELFIAKYVRTHGPLGGTGEANVTTTGRRSILHTEDTYILMHEGCVFGWPALEVRDRRASNGVWKYSNAIKKSPRAGREGNEGDVLCPATVTALEDSVCLTCSIQTIEQFLFDSARVPGFHHTTSAILECRSREESLFSRVESQSPRLSSKQTSGVSLMPSSVKSPWINFQADRMEVLGNLGEGAFGSVVKARYLIDNKIYALKYVEKDRMRKGNKDMYEAEKEMLTTFDCPFIVKYYGSYETDVSIVLVTEVLERGDLWSALYDNPIYDKDGLPPDVARFYMSCLVLAMDHIHAHNVVYRDLKPENVMIDGRGMLRLIDFGLAKRVPYEEPDLAAGGGKMRRLYRAFSVCGTFGASDT